jgi:hypothetical protein
LTQNTAIAEGSCHEGIAALSGLLKKHVKKYVGQALMWDRLSCGTGFYVGQAFQPVEPLSPAPEDRLESRSHSLKDFFNALLRHGRLE